MMSDTVDLNIPRDAAEARAERAEAEADSLRATINNMRAMNIKLTFEATGKVLSAEAECEVLREVAAELLAIVKGPFLFGNADKIKASITKARAVLNPSKEPSPCSKTS
jgi:hypothetical protein